MSDSIQLYFYLTNFVLKYQLSEENGTGENSVVCMYLCLSEAYSSLGFNGSWHL